jgi:hypothetical protein
MRTLLDGVYRAGEGGPVFQEVPAPTVEQLQALLVKIITRSMKLLTRLGALIEEQGLTYLAEIDAHSALTPLQAASCTYRIALSARTQLHAARRAGISAARTVLGSPG